MPTPESSMFKAQKPTVPPTFEGVDYTDSAAYTAAQDAVIREQWVGMMMAQLVREELGKCYVRDRANHLQNCGRLRDRYLELLRSERVRGTMFISRHQLPEAARPGGGA